jgi:hypothetical protein
MIWAQLLAYVTGTVEQELLLRNEYLASRVGCYSHKKKKPHQERNHQGKENRILFPTQTEARRKKDGAVRCRERLGGLLKYYEQEAA